MISISLQGLAETESRLRSLMDAKLAAKAAKAAAETYAEATLDWIAEGKSFKSRTGQLEQSIGWRGEGGGAVVYANAEYAPYMEEGTGLYGPNHAKYPIRPKAGRKALAIPMPGGGFLSRKLVMHPGIQAKPFFFADFEGRKEKMGEAVMSILAAKLAGKG